MAKFDSNVHQIRVPTLLIGIGGIGGRIVSGVYDQLSDYDKSYVEMVVMDTNTNDLRPLKEKGLSVVQTSQSKTVQGYLELHPEFLDWFPTNPLINNKNLQDGAGQIRSVSRLGALASESAGEFDKIDTAIKALKLNRGEALTSAVKVMIVGSITGGTGSGLGVQLPFYIREAISKESNAPDILIRGLFLCPDITATVQPTPENKEAMYVNGYAFIRELNAFYRAQLLDDGEIMVDVEHYNKGLQNVGVADELKSANQIPYNFMFLLETSNINGCNLGELSAYERQAAKIVKNQLFSKFSGSQFSVEDNLIIGSIAHRGMNRYCGAGFASAKYPKDEMMKYCTLKYSDTVIKDFWRYFDVKFENESYIQRINMAHNPALQPLVRADHYIKTFDDMTKDMDAPSEIALLRRDVERTYQDESGIDIHEPVPAAVCKAISDLISDSIDEIADKAGYQPDTFQLKPSLMKNAETAQGEVIRVINALNDYMSKTRTKVSEYSSSCVEKILPANLISAEQDKDNAGYNLFARLKKMHPLAARYVLYVLAERFEKEAKRAENLVVDLTETEIKQDYHPMEGNQSATQTFAIFANRSLAEKIGGAFTGDYSKAVKMLTTDVSLEVGRIEDFREAKLTATIYAALAERVKKLIVVFEAFFDGLQTILDNNANEIRMFEAVHDHVHDGEYYVCADGVCKKAIFDEVYLNATGEMMELSEDVKTALFTRFYEEYEGLVVTTKSFDAKEKYEFNHVEDVFDECVLPKMKEQVRRAGDAIINMSVFEAIDKEYDIKMAIEKEAGRDVLLDKKQNAQQVFERVANLATPYISYDSKTTVIVSAYWGVNASTIKYLGNYAGAGAIIDLFDCGDGCNNDVVEDASFSPYEIGCYKAVYGLEIENLLRYRKNTLCYNSYFKRLDDVLYEHAELSKDKSAYLATVHPHLDKKWHNRAYLPMLASDDEIDERYSDIKVYLLGCALDWFKYTEHDYTSCWCYENDEEILPVIKNGAPVKAPAVYELFEAIDYNKLVKEEIIKRADEIKSKEKAGINPELATGDMRDFYYDAISAHTIIKALCKTALDMVCNIYYTVGYGSLVKECLNFLKNYITAYCLDMVNGQQALAEIIACRIFDDMRKQSGKYATINEVTRTRIDKTLPKSEVAEDDTQSE